jgi:hypothetical protein
MENKRSTWTKDPVVLSEDFKLILEKPPGWFVRSGIALLLGLFIILLLFCGFGKYPESVLGDVRIVSLNSRKKVMAQTTGPITLLVQDESKVNKGQFLGIIHSSLHDKEDILALIRKLDNLYQNYFDAIYADSAHFEENIFLEEIQFYYDDFLKKRRDYLTYDKLKPHHKQKIEVLQNLRLTSQLKVHREAQFDIFKNKVEIENKRLSISDRLYKNEVIAASDMEDAREKALDKHQVLELAKEELIQLDLSRQQLVAKLEELNVKIVEDSIRYKGNLQDAFKLLYSKIKEWESMHVLTAPSDGRVYFSEYWSTEQFVLTKNQEVLSVVPTDENVFGIGRIMFQRAGEVKAGQNVNIYLESFIAEDFGIVKGKIKDINPIPSDTSYRLTIELPEGLVTSYARTIPFSPELKGKVEIITKNTTILQKLFNKMRKFSDRVNLTSNK